MEALSGAVTVLITFFLSIPIILGIQNIFAKRRHRLRKSKLFQDQAKSSNRKGEELKRHTGEFDEKEVLQVLDNIYVAIGYGLANCIMLEGEDGIVIIDTMESNDAAQEVLKEFRKITKKPIKGIVLTHFHADHTNGISVFLDECGEDAPEIVTHDSLPKFLGQVMNVRSQITYKRAVRQFGTEIPDEVLKNAGIGMKLNLDKLQGFADVTPTITFSKKLSLELAGLQLEMIHAPGETDDQIMVWYPEKKVLFPADNIYKAFPNLYAIRGTMNRDTLQWVAALDLMLDLEPKYLVPQHTRPLEGKEDIAETVTAYRDAIQYVHDQTVRFMNKGLSGTEIAEIVQLPPHLRHHPYLIEYYGTVEWSVRSVFTGYMGWFSGKPADLHPLPIKEEAREMLTLLGGRAKLEDHVRLAVEDGKYQLGLKLTDILADSQGTGPESLDSAMRELRSRCLQMLASREVSAPGMNWYLTEDMVMKGLEIKPSNESKVSRIKSGNIKSLFLMLSCMIDPEETADVRMISSFNFTDTEVKLTVVIRQGVAIVRDTREDKVEADMEVVTTEKVWREVMAKERNALMASMAGELTVVPAITKLSTFFSYFDTEV